MNAKDIMTSPVITVGPETTVRAIAALPYERESLLSEPERQPWRRRVSSNGIST